MAPEKHQAALDGVRGFAAVSVVLFHVGRWLDVPLASNSNLAVDLFFMLSGFVLSLAYAPRLDGGMTARRFMAARLARLMPLVVLASVVSALCMVLRLYAKHEDAFLPALGAATLLGVVGLPDFAAPAAIGGGQAFPLNGPQYSLFFEIAANAAWAAVAPLRRSAAAGVLAAGCFALVGTAGLLGGDTPGTFLAGFPRVGASFLAGVAAFHIERALPPWRWWPVVFWICGALMIATFYSSPLPFAAGLSWVMTVAPLLIVSGSRTALRGRLRTAALAAGRLSYPVYVLHYPLFAWVNGFTRVVTHQRDAALEGAVLITAVTIAAPIALRFYDEPIRGWLNARRAQPALFPRAPSADRTTALAQLGRDPNGA